jgi:hypothetical protein
LAPPPPPAAAAAAAAAAVASPAIETTEAPAPAAPTAAQQPSDTTPPPPPPAPATPPTKETLKKELQEFIKTTFNNTSIDSETKIIKVIEYLDTKIDTKKTYTSMYKNATEIGASSFSGKKVSQVEIIKQSESQTKDSVTSFLRWLLKTDVSTFKRPNKVKFYDFFQKVVSTGALKDLAELRAAVLAPKNRVTRSKTRKA